jgi:hypothetical protein
MELSGKILQKLSLQTGTGKNGEWKKQEYIIESKGHVPRKVCFSLWGDKINQFDLKEGEEVTVAFDLESREYNGRWYTDVRAWKITSTSETRKKQEGSAPEITDEIPENSNLSDDLPF